MSKKQECKQKAKEIENFDGKTDHLYVYEIENPSRARNLLKMQAQINKNVNTIKITSANYKKIYAIIETIIRVCTFKNE